MTENEKDIMITARVPSELKFFLINIAKEEQGNDNPNLSKFILFTSLKGIGFKSSSFTKLKVKGLGVLVNKCFKCKEDNIMHKDEIIVCSKCYTFYKVNKKNELEVMNDLK